MISATEGVPVDGLGLEDDLRVSAGGLIRGGAVIVPVRELGGFCCGGGDGAALGAELEETVEPDVFGHDFGGVGRGEVEKTLDLFVCGRGKHGGWTDRGDSGGGDGATGST